MARTGGAGGIGFGWAVMRGSSELEGGGGGATDRFSAPPSTRNSDGRRGAGGMLRRDGAID